MDLGSVSSLASRLLSALEKTGTSSGAELRSDFGPSGQPDPELVRAFERALEQPAESGHNHLTASELARTGGNVQPKAKPQGLYAQESSRFLEISATRAPEAAPLASPHLLDPEETRAPTSTPRVSPVANKTELEEMLQRMNTETLRPEDLFRAQYLVGMLKVHAQSGMQTSQKMAEGFDTLLKQKG